MLCARPLLVRLVPYIKGGDEVALVGYARVSTNMQDTQLQLDALEAAGVTVVYSEKTSSVGVRPQLRRALACLKRGDVLVVWKLDRIARSLHDLLSILARLKTAGVGLRSLTEPIDTASPIGEFMVQVLGAVAQLEKAMIRERAIAGQVAAYRQGKRWGGTLRVLSDAEVDELVRLRATGVYPLTVLADAFDCSVATVQRWYKRRTRPEVWLSRRLPVLGAHLQHAAHGRH